MKLAAALLAIANLLLGWFIVYPQPQQSENRPVVAGVTGSVESLTLLRERPGVVSADQGERRAPLPETLGNATAQRMDPAQPIPAQAVPATGESRTTGSAAAVEPSASHVDPDRIAVATYTSGRVCQTIGPFVTRESAESLLDALQGMNTDAVLRAAQIEQPSGYRVYLPPMPATDAERIVAEFSQRGVKDYFLGRQNFVSLGVFSDKASAEKRFSDIADLGYMPKLEARFLTQEIFWVDLAEPADRSFSEAQWADILRGESGVERRPVSCE